MPRGSAGVERVPDGLVLPAPQALVEAQRLLDQGRPFHAHEVLEGVWKGTAPDPERDLWQGLAQLCVGLTHIMRGNPTGAAALLRRGRERIAPYATAPPHDIDVPGLLDWVTGALAVAEGMPDGACDDVPSPHDIPAPDVVTPRLMSQRHGE
jgi:hypothetical protein